MIERLFPSEDLRPPSEMDGCRQNGLMWLDHDDLDRLLNAAREEGRLEGRSQL